MKKPIKKSGNKIDKVEEIYEEKNINEVEFSSAHNDLNEYYFPYICANPKSYGAECLLFWMDTVKSVRIKAICLAKLFSLSLNDENMVCEIFKTGRSHNLQNLKSDCGFNHNLKDDNYCDAVGIRLEDFKKAVDDLDSLFFAGHIQQMVNILECFLKTSLNNNVKAATLHILFRNLIEEKCLDEK